MREPVDLALLALRVVVARTYRIGHDGVVPMLWRIFVGNAAVLTVATLALVLSPATVSFPLAAQEAVVLGLGLVVMLAVNFVMVRRAVAPLERLTGVMRSIDPLAPGRSSGLTSAPAEVGALAGAFDQMLDRLEAERRESARRALGAQEEERRVRDGRSAPRRARSSRLTCVRSSSRDC